MRLALLWTSAMILPPTMVRMAMTQTIGSQSALAGASATSNTRAKAINAAAFVPTDIKAVMGAGAPWYTSGVHEWKGTADTLKQKPTAISPIAISSSVEDCVA